MQENELKLFFKQWCNDTKRAGGVLIGKSVNEFLTALSKHLEYLLPSDEIKTIRGQQFLSNHYLKQKKNNMGCHTWFYKKVIISEEKLKSDALKICDLNIMLWQAYLDFSNKIPIANVSDWMNEFIISFSTQSEEELQKQIETNSYLVNSYKRIKRFVEKDIYKTAGKVDLYNYILKNEFFQEFDLENGSYKYCKRNNAIYINSNELPYDLFRIGGYPKNQLLSLKETMKFLEDNKDKIRIFYGTTEKLENFWKQYPDGMICFG